jgi:glycosyltransferase involved in cell wall biosynthesis
VKIAQVIAVSDYIGGDQTHVLALVGGLTARGHDCVVLLGPSGGVFAGQLKELGIAVRIIPSLYKPLHPVRDLRALVELVFALRRLKPDVIAAHTSKAGFLGRMAGYLLRVPTVFTPHGWSIVDRATGKIKKGYCVLEKIAGLLGSNIIAVSHSEQEIGRLSGITSPEKILVVYNGIADVAESADRKVDPPTIVMVARFQKQKDQRTLIRAVTRIADRPWRLQFVGSGPLLPQMKEFARSAGVLDRIEFLGERSNTQDILAKADIFVLSSLWEAFPISTLEAMRAGLPVIVSDVGGAAESVIDGTTGFIVPRSRDDLMAESLSVLLRDTALRERIGRNGRKLFLEKFTLNTMVESTLDIYRDAIHQQRQSLYQREAQSSNCENEVERPVDASVAGRAREAQ